MRGASRKRPPGGTPGITLPLIAPRPGIKLQAPGHRLPVPAGRRFGEAGQALANTHQDCTLKWHQGTSGSPPHEQALALVAYR